MKKILFLAFLLSIVYSQNENIVPKKNTVRVIYLVPADRQVNLNYKNAIQTTLIELQSWYYGHLQGRTFQLNDPIVEIYDTNQNASWYNEHEPPEVCTKKEYYTFYNAANEVITRCNATFFDSDYIWLVYIDAPGGTGAGMPSMAVLPEHDLQGIVGKNLENLNIFRWYGGHAHELGHAFGLEHPPENVDFDALMQFGYSHYPACYLTKKDLDTLANVHFLIKKKPNTLVSEIKIYQGGYFIHTKEKNWEERKVNDNTLFKFEEIQREQDTIVIHDSERNLFIKLPLYQGMSLISTNNISWELLYEIE